MNAPLDAIRGMRPITSRTLVLAGILSLLAHLVIYGGYRLVKTWHFSGYDRLMAAITPKPSPLPSVLIKWLIPAPKPVDKPPALPTPSRELTIVLPPPAPAVFVPVDPMTASTEEPKDPKYYSDKNSLAANPTIKKESDQPNIEGRQTHVPRTTDSQPVPLKPLPAQNPQPRPPDRQPSDEGESADVARPLQPATAPPQPEPLQPTEQRPPGNLALARPTEAVKPSPPASPRAEPGPERPATQPARPRTLVEARARMQDSAIAGEKMKQEGGVKNRLTMSALDAKATPYGAYDAMIVTAVQQRWYDLLDRSRFSRDRRGKVVVDFQLHASGRVTDVEVVENTVGDFLASLCQMAITDPAPYGKWPEEMQRVFPGRVRKVRFTFFYD